MLRTRLILFSFFAAAVVMLQSCSIGDDLVAQGGNTSEVSNGRVIGTLYTSNGAPAESALVQAYPVDYDPTDPGSDTIAWAVTDSTGSYVIETADTGYLNVQASLDSFGALIDSIDIPLSTNDVYVPVDTLRRLGCVAGIVHPTDVFDPYMRLRAFIPGSSYGVLTYPDSHFVIEDIPEDHYSLTVFTGRTIYADIDIPIAVTAGDTLFLDTLFIYPR